MMSHPSELAISTAADILAIFSSGITTEYAEAVDAVRWGWTLWMTFIAPAVVVWAAVFVPAPESAKRRMAIGCATFAFACFLFWFLTILHGNRIQSTKELHMQTDAEKEDWASDTWLAFAPITAVPVSLIYCTVNLTGAVLVRGLIVLATRWSHRHCRTVAMRPSDETLLADSNPYHPPDQS